MEAGLDAIYEELLNVAKGRRVTYYSDIAPLAGLDMNSEVDRIRIAQILGEISKEERRAGRPLLSAVVVLKDQNVPGRGFFDLASSLGLYDGRDDVSYWTQELRSVHQYWSTLSDRAPEVGLNKSTE